ncbi:MAG: hypothetical protein HFJ36_00450 [Clostridia bacterium]|nr:hypothetical protein [Clostridia bacterium]
MNNLKEQKKSYKTNTEKGITLVALVITVIILIILAGITIAGLTGEKGLIKEAKTAKELTELAGLEEQIELAIIKAEQKHRNPTMGDVIEELINNKVISNESRVNQDTGAIHTDLGYLIEGKLDDYIGKTSTGDGNTTGGGTTNPPEAILPSTDNTKPFLPEGATQVEGTNLETGLVIKDSNDNEWVWVEVPKSIYNTTTTSTDYSAIETAMHIYTSDYRNSSCSDTFYSTEQHGFSDATEYNSWRNSMLKSVFINGGFYIGRYEVGTDTARFSKSATLTKPYIKQDMIPYNYVTCRQAQTLSKELATGGKQASLMFGVQWDLVLKFIEAKGAKRQQELKTDSGSWGNYYNVSFDLKRGKYLSASTWNNITNYTKLSDSAALLTTGATNRNSALNIYDLAGNIHEWTLEYTSSTSAPCCIRGGDYKDYASTYSVKNRSGNSTPIAESDNGFRVALW